MEYYSVLKVNESSGQKETQRNLKHTRFSEGSQPTKATDCTIPAT